MKTTEQYGPVRVVLFIWQYKQIVMFQSKSSEFFLVSVLFLGLYTFIKLDFFSFSFNTKLDI